MAKNGTCELCGLPDDSYTIEDGGKVFKVCRLCHDGFIEKQGLDPSAPDVDPIDELVGAVSASPEHSGKVETLTPDQMAKLLTPTSEEKRKLYASLRKAAKNGGNNISADTEELKRELAKANEEIEEEKRLQAMRESVKSAGAELGEAVKTDEVDSTVEEAMKKLMTAKSPSEKEQDALDSDIRSKRAEEKRAAAREKAQKAANPTIDDERISITSPEIELENDKRPKTNFDAATAEHVKSVRFIEAFKYVMHPVVYSIFAGLIVLAVATAFMITLTWKEALIDFFAGAGAVAIGYLLVWYLKRRFEIDRRTVLLRIRQEQIVFESITTPCYRELKTKYPIIKALAWLLSKLSVIMPVVIIVAGSATAVIVSFLSFWWLLAPVLVGAVVGAVLAYYIIKFAADSIYYKLDLERNQQIAEQTLLDLLAKKK